MIHNKILYTFIIFTSFVIKSVLTLDKIECQASLWFNEYVKDLEYNEKIELYNGMNDLSIFIAYQVLAQKKISHIARLTTFFKNATINEEGEIIKSLSCLVHDLSSEYPIKTNYELRVSSFYEQCEQNIRLQQALNAFLDDVKNFIQQETVKPSSVLVLQIEKTNNQIYNCIEILEHIKQKVGQSDTIPVCEFRGELMNHYYKCQSIIEEEIYQYVIETCENQTLFNTLILFYMDNIIKKID